MPKPKYRHMRQWESAIVDKFHAKIKLKGEFEYDVALRVREIPLPGYKTENEQMLWNRLTAKRIDVVATTKAAIYVIEVKDRLRPSAVGQALTYKILYEEQFKPSQPVIPSIVTEFGDPDMQHVCDVYNIKVWVV